MRMSVMTMHGEVMMLTTMLTFMGMFLMMKEDGDGFEDDDPRW